MGAQEQVDGEDGTGGTYIPISIPTQYSLLIFFFNQSARIFMDSTGIQMPVDEYIAENTAIQTELFATTKVLPGVEVRATVQLPLCLDG